MAIQEPKLVPTIYKAYEKEYPHKIWSYMVQYLHILDPEIPIDTVYIIVIMV